MNLSYRYKDFNVHSLTAWQLGEYSYIVITVKNTESYSLRASLKTRNPEFPLYTSLKLLYYL